MPPSLNQKFVAQLAVAVLLPSTPANAAAHSFDIQHALHYIPSKAISAAGFAVYFILSALLFWRLIRARDWWGLCLPLASLCESLGFLLRAFIGRPHLRTSLGYYIATNLLVVLSPAAFLAFNYIVYGRLMRLCAGPAHSRLRPQHVGRIFVISDIATFLVQAAGGSLQIQESTAAAGGHIFLVGIILQAVSYGIYLALVVSSQRSVRAALALKDRDQPSDEVWYAVFTLLYFSSFFIVIRSIYRIVESAQGFGGYLLTHEWGFIALDSVPLAIAIAVYIPYWPGDYIPKDGARHPSGQQHGMVPIRSEETEY